ncbi:protein-glutamate O-methyltransferase CheR [Vibrio sp. 10N.261.55.A7]|uniref:CheR family methyltransferase n=1 Tax=Vibrio sp. 10N.261.55.A7 TaxID=1880851 RepID=UPI000C82EDE5|nr:protein-glutamate O-methyltransferase CheR [Vibrio sp. 10N.261.55.A7]PMK05140.1 chemotaxis protein CheR [Vibrio sp. 10N.261.55.A7]
MSVKLNETQFARIQKLVESCTGIHLAKHKMTMVESRLQVRISKTHHANFEEYLDSLADRSVNGEFWFFIDKMTTHETSFFREDYQFNILEKLLDTTLKSRPIKAWSAACSTGEEAYSLAMILQDTLGTGNWSLLGTDVSELSIEQAKACQYDLSGAEKIPAHYRKSYCLKGIGEFSDHFTLVKSLRSHCQFQSHNLLKPKGKDLYDVIFLRNILIYFSTEIQQLIVTNIISALKLNGLLFLGHSENILRGNPNVTLIDNCTYQKVGYE